MLRKIRTARYLLAASLLLVLITINSKDVLHGFATHNPISCIEHIEGEDELNQHPIAALDSYKYCLFCHFEFSTYFLPEEFAPTGNAFEYLTISTTPIWSIYLPEQHRSLSLRGPPTVA
jgi:hypothetical protein